MFTVLHRWFTRMPAARLLTAGFALVILLGAFLLWLPVSHNPGRTISFLDALFEAGSAVCVTGLTVVTVGDTFNLFGRFVMAVLIQIGGMGVVLLGIALILLAGGKMSFKARSLFVAAQNLFGYSGVYDMAKKILIITFAFEAGGALLLWPVLLQYFDPLKAFGHACFLSVSAFNNAGFDVFYEGQSLIPYAGDTAFNLIICVLVVCGGFGFIAMMDLYKNRFKWKKLMLTTKISLVMTIGLLTAGTVLLLITTDETLLESFFQSVIARTAGFATYPLADFSSAGILIFVILMFIGASPNSTGGGVKTNTVFVAGLKAISSTTAHDEDSVFFRRVPDLVFTKAFTVIFFGMLVVLTGTLLVAIAQPEASLSDVIVEVVSAFATVGSSCGLTGDLCSFSKIIIILCMFIGRVGPVTIANLLVTKNESQAQFTEESVLIG